MEEIRTERLFLRPWRKDDEEPLVLLANNRKIWLNVRDLFPHPYTHEDAQNWIHLSRTNPLHYNYAIQWTEHMIGGIGLHRMSDVYRRTVEIGYWIGEPFWGQGFATEAVRALSEWGFKSLDIVRIQAGVFEWNKASMRVLEKAGFHFESKLEKAITKEEKTVDEWLWVRLAPA